MDSAQTGTQSDTKGPKSRQKTQLSRGTAGTITSTSSGPKKATIAPHLLHPPKSAFRPPVQVPVARCSLHTALSFASLCYSILCILYILCILCKLCIIWFLCHLHFFATFFAYILYFIDSYGLKVILCWYNNRYSMKLGTMWPLCLWSFESQQSQELQRAALLALYVVMTYF